MLGNVMSFMRTPSRVKCKMIEKQEAPSNSTRPGVQGGSTLSASSCRYCSSNDDRGPGERKDDPSFLSSTTGVVGKTEKEILYERKYPSCCPVGCRYRYSVGSASSNDTFNVVAVEEDLMSS